MRENRPLGYYNYTVILTYAGLLFAVAGILLTMGDRLSGAALCLVLSGVCDMFDGAVAATRPRSAHEKRFGIQIDSLCDLVSFGVLPGVFVYRQLGQRPEAAVVAALYMLCALIRLAYFNVQEEDRQETTEERRSGYLGVPVTTIAFTLPALYILSRLGLHWMKPVFLCLLGLEAIGFLAPLHLRKPHAVGKIGVICLGAVEFAALLLLLLGVKLL